MPALLVADGRPGFYLRVLQEGEVEAGQEIFKVRAGAEGMSVTEVSNLLYLPPTRGQICSEHFESPRSALLGSLPFRLSWIAN